MPSELAEQGTQESLSSCRLIPERQGIDKRLFYEGLINQFY